MGTNYYLYDQPPCESCGRPFERWHIGKSSAGWCFALHVEPGDPDHPQSLDEWALKWGRPGTTIQDEYGEWVSPVRMADIITNREWPLRADRPRFYLEANHAEPGPHGLMRHRIGEHCVGHGEGTWDLIAGEFS